jgi:hypothetical protein
MWVSATSARTQVQGFSCSVCFGELDLIHVFQLEILLWGELALQQNFLWDLSGPFQRESPAQRKSVPSTCGPVQGPLILVIGG